jgi:hypothetical protein
MVRAAGAVWPLTWDFEARGGEERRAVRSRSMVVPFGEEVVHEATNAPAAASPQIVLGMERSRSVGAVLDNMVTPMAMTQKARPARVF